MGFIIRTAGTLMAGIAGILAVLLVTVGANAGSSTYDLIPLLNDPHPFAPPHSAPVAQPAPAPAMAPNPRTEDTLAALLGLTTGSGPRQTQVANSSVAGASAQPQAKADDPSFITIGGGWYDFNDNEQAAEFHAEWRGKKLFWIFKPFAGAMFTSDAAFYGFGGFLTDFYFGRRIVVTPSIAAGLYADGDGKDLGSVIEFRSGLEVGWRFDDRSRLSAAVYHISNAGIDDNNPGTEIFSIGYSFPLY
jgi:hypothetical protein